MTQCLLGSVTVYAGKSEKIKVLSKSIWGSGLGGGSLLATKKVKSFSKFIAQVNLNCAKFAFKNLKNVLKVFENFDIDTQNSMKNAQKRGKVKSFWVFRARR